MKSNPFTKENLKEYLMKIIGPDRRAEIEEAAEELPNLINPLYIECNCLTDLMQLSYDEKFDLIDLAIYEYGQNTDSRLTLWDRLRFMWKILWTGSPWNDSITLNKEGRKKLVSWLSNIDKSDCLDDGYGNEWPAKCPDCKDDNQIVRPGKVQCGCTNVHNSEKEQGQFI